VASRFSKIGNPPRNARLANQAIKAASKKFEPSIARAFAKAIASVKDDLTLRRLTVMIERGELTQALELVGQTMTSALTSGVPHPAAKRVVPSAFNLSSKTATLAAAEEQMYIALEALSIGQPAAYTEVQLSLLQDIISDARAGGNFKFVVDSRGRIVGGASWKPAGPGRVELLNLFSTKGRVGSGLVGEVLRENPGATVDLLSAGRAQGFYEHLGAIPTEGGRYEFRPGKIQHEITGAFKAGAAAGTKQLPPDIALRASLDLTNPEALRYLRTHIPTLIREVTDETMKAIQSTLVRGFSEGIPPVKMAREIRGVIGLTEKQAQAVANFREQLESGRMGVGQAPWDRRLSATERARAGRIFRAGGKTGPDVDALVSRYEQSLVNRRAMNISVTETNTAFGEGQDELWRQAEEQGLIDPTKTMEHWLYTKDEHTRKDHRRVPIDNPGGVMLGGFFRTVVGPVRGPRTSGNASFDINCRCSKYLEFLE